MAKIQRPFPAKPKIRIPKEDERILKETASSKRDYKFMKAAYKMGYAKGKLNEAFALPKQKKYWK